MPQPSWSPASISTKPPLVLGNAPQGMAADVVAGACGTPLKGGRRGASETSVRKACGRLHDLEPPSELHCSSLEAQSPKTELPLEALRPFPLPKLPRPPVRSEVAVSQHGHTHFVGPVQRRLSWYHNYCGKAPSALTRDVGCGLPDNLRSSLFEPRQLCSGVVDSIDGASRTAAAAQQAENTSGAQHTERRGSKDSVLDSASLSEAAVNALRTTNTQQHEVNLPLQSTLKHPALRRAHEDVEEEKRSPRATKARSLAELRRSAPQSASVSLRVAFSTSTSADVAASPRASDRSIPVFTIAQPAFTPQAKAAMERDRGAGPAQTLTALQVVIRELIVAEIAARKELWMSFLAAQYELLMMEMSCKSCCGSISAPRQREHAFHFVLGTISFTMQRYFDLSLEESLMWMGDLYLDLYKAPTSMRQPARHQHASGFVDLPQPIAARRFISVLAQPTSTSAAPSAGAGVTPSPTSRFQELITSNKERHPTFHSSLNQHPRGLTNLASTSNDTVFTVPFALQMSLRVVEEFAVVRHIALPHLLEAAAVQIRSHVLTRASGSATGLGSPTNDTVWTGSVSSGAERGEALVPVCRATAQLTSTEDVSPQGPEPSLQRAFWGLVRRWNSAGKGAVKPQLRRATAAAAKVVFLQPLVPSLSYATSLVVVKRLSKLFRDEVAFNAVDDNPFSSRYFYALPGVTFQRVAAQLEALMLSHELYASVQTAAASHFGFAERLHVERGFGAATSVGTAQLQRIVMHCAQEAVDLYAALLVLSCHERELWLHHVQCIFRTIMPLSHTRPCVVAGADLTGLKSPPVSVLVQLRQRTPCPPTLPLVTCLYMQRLHHLSRVSDVSEMPVILFGDPITSRSVAPAAVTATTVMASGVPRLALGHPQLLTARENSCRLPPSASSSDPLSGGLSTPIEHSDSGDRAHALSLSAQTSCSYALATSSAGGSFSSGCLEASLGCRRILYACSTPGQQTPCFQASSFPSVLQMMPRSALCCSGGVVQYFHDNSRLVVLPLKVALASHYTGKSANWDIAMLLRSEAYARAFAMKQQCCEAQLLNAWKADSLQSLKASAHIARTVARMHHVGRVYRQCDRSRHFWDKVCMEKQLFVDRWVKEREGLQFQLYAEAAVLHRLEVQLNCLARLTEEFQSMTRYVRDYQSASFSLSSPRYISA
ncbi:hypothetical protein GH5_03998 [Leishmania sp. Ghana 2012 LV757]|uniref:hypothetical protein n=1 Tax=Leishmania sp. Ghana 2012 LV757 TaxID=2803181 RepID=UPI001B3D5756|nr:hypothetical protein GH5_03998 [Leishmania sp. Ghana 2012 LV757]